MNFPDSKRTGTLGELDIERLFVSWSWNVGTDRIDTGYDLFVAPDSKKYSGARFLIQAKGTARTSKNGRVTAKVSKSRLREYAVNVHPVFVVRVTGDGKLFWIHAQKWAAENSGQLRGDGYSQIRFALENDLSDRYLFERYLEQLLKDRPQFPIVHEADDVRVLNSLDPNVGVKISRGPHGPRHEIYAKSDPVHATFNFRAPAGRDNLQRATEALGFGLPRTFDVEDLSLLGSPVFSAIAGKKLSNATVSIQPIPARYSTVRLYPGCKFSINSPALVIRARFFQGALGMAISTDNMDSVFNVKLLLPQPDSPQKPEFSLKINDTAMAGKPVKEFDELAPVANWVEKVNLERSLYLEISYKGKTGRLNPDSGAFLACEPLLRWLLLIGKLHLVAKALDSDFTLPSDPYFSRQDVSDIDLAYCLLKGDATKIHIKRLLFTPRDGVAVPFGKHDYYLSTNLGFSLLGQYVGEIPVTIRLSKFSVETDADTGNVLISKGADGSAEIAHAP
ncbi:DUF4365 domain-containing protein [Achromobacter marplatensis]|uniref:DUF4365 domain-containing protein n=1 Tax=Achromobacter marplatensis TaxID=470868 RepID=UPI000310B13B|nr:DUF4365 domain-containing protein [Achromobacter marplatensis]